MRFQSYVSNSAAQADSSETSWSSGWYHYAATWGSGGMKQYINGVLDGTNTRTTVPILGTQKDFIIGANNFATIGSFLNGSIDEVRVYSRALLPEEIRTHYLRGSGHGASGAITANVFRVVNTSGTARIHMDADGNVGIGTTSPTSTLHVVGDSNFTETIFYGGNLTGYGADYAEMFEKLDPSERIEPGDIVAIVEGKITTSLADASLYMVVTDSAALIGNAGKGSVPIAFVGQVKTKVSGKVREGDYILASGSSAGYAKPKRDVSFEEFKSKVVGIALESKESIGIKRINVAVGVK
jgi:hypothetical protein